LIKENNELVAKHLSRNQTLHSYGETSHEFFGSLIRDIAWDLDKGVPLTEEVFNRHFELANKKSSCYGTVMGCRPYLLACLKANSYRAYFQDTKLFQAFYIEKHVIGVYGAVSNIIILIY
jgi:hypothetical protein